jgi:hypothetical protein
MNLFSCGWVLELQNWSVENCSLTRMGFHVLRRDFTAGLNLHNNLTYPPTLSATGSIVQIDGPNILIVRYWVLLYFFPFPLASSAAESHLIHSVGPVEHIDVMPAVCCTAILDLDTPFLILDMPPADFLSDQWQQAAAFFTSGHRKQPDINKAACIQDRHRSCSFSRPE